MKYKLILKYVYNFYSSGELITEDVFSEEEDIEAAAKRITLHDQEDGSFVLSSLASDYIGNYVTLTYPNKDVLIVREDKDTELCYDEYYSAMGDDNHNVYVGIARLEACK